MDGGIFLEPGESVKFTSLIDPALKGGKYDSVDSLKFTLLKGESASFLLEDISVSTREMPTEDVAYISDGKYKLGVKLTWGGGVSYLEDLTDGDDSITNLLNDHDTGRLIQQSYYGTDQYDCGTYMDNKWNYNLFLNLSVSLPPCERTSCML